MAKNECPYCNNPIHVDYFEPQRRWFKEFEQVCPEQGSWHLFYRPEGGWHISHNGTLHKISACPMCGRKLKRFPDDGQTSKPAKPDFDNDTPDCDDDLHWFYALINCSDENDGDQVTVYGRKEVDKKIAKLKTRIKTLEDVLHSHMDDIAKLIK